MLSKHEQIIFYFTNESFAKANWSGDISVDKSWVMDDKSGFKVQLPDTSGCFYCNNEYLSTLEGAPKHVRGDFDCAFNRLTTLEGAPQYVGRHFNCFHNNLTTIKGMPKFVGGDFNCAWNIGLTIYKKPDGVIGEFIRDES